MALKARNKAPTVRIQAAPALAMAFFEQKGLTELIDSRFDLDKRIKLTPGNAVKAMVGQMMSTERRRALFGLNDFYVQAPIGRLFGKRVDLKDPHTAERFIPVAERYEREGPLDHSGGEDWRASWPAQRGFQIILRIWPCPLSRIFRKALF